jgi:hypothetical protein
VGVFGFLAICQREDGGDLNLNNLLDGNRVMHDPLLDILVGERSVRPLAGERAFFPLGPLCRVMRVSESAYHAYARGKSYALSPQKAVLAAMVKETFYLHRRRYGSRRNSRRKVSAPDGVRCGR